MITICVNEAGKCIKNTWIFREVSANFESGKIYGLIGRNGAGKTMLLKSICGLTSLTEGKITVNGKVLGEDTDIPESIGVIIEVPGFLPNLSGFANLKYLANLKKQIDDEKIRQALLTVGLQPENRKHVSKYSLGMRQRLGLAQAIMEDPSILLLDEPMNGLDNKGVEDAKQLLRGLRSSGKTIIIASHHMEDISELCDTVYLMDSGRIKQVKIS